MRPFVHWALVAGTALAPTAALAQAVDYSALSEVVGEPVTTSVTGKPQRASELPASTVIITRDEIDRSPARDVPDLLKSYAGIDVNRWTAGQSDVAVRGGVQTYNARLLVLVDGRQVYLDHYGMTDWNLLGVPLEDIQQIELVRGPASALFGFNAASGVVNIITRRPGAGPTLVATGEAGGHGYDRIAGSLSVPITQAIGAKLTAGHLEEDERDIPAPLLAPSDVSGVRADSVSGTLTGRFARSELTLDGGYASNRQLEYLPSQYLSDQDYHIAHVALGLKQDTNWGGLSLDSYVNWLNADYGLNGGAPGAAATGVIAGTTSFANRIIVVQGSALVRLGEGNTLRVGAEYRNNDLQSDAQFSRDLFYNVASGNMMLDLHPTDRLALTVAGRIDQLWLGEAGALSMPEVDTPADFDQDFLRVSFNAAVVAQVGSSGQLRINGGRGYQLPSLVDFGLRIPILTPAPVPVFIAGDANTRPVGVWSAEIGYNQQLGTTRLEGTGFWTRTDNAIGTPGDGLQLDLVTTPLPVLVSRIRAIGDFTTYGVELAASGHQGPLSWKVNYTFTHSDDDLPAAMAPYPFAFSPGSTTPRHKANVELGYDAGRWYLSALGRYTSATRQFAFTTTPQLLLVAVDQAFAVDARAGLRLTPNVELFAASENLTLAGGAAVSPIPADRRMRGGLKVTL